MNFKEVEKWEGTRNVRIPHIVHTLTTFLEFLDCNFSRDPLNTS